ncbi:Rgg/GadR/MutR family transcriptional regulator [Lactobacillus sp. LL6]|uniref:helix-turn-helix domain-containing protein n=1 Tax=Lactobacillus sp. LL6 TaxID=2596827 RepID=UPI001185E74E|nr:Rgg/GadR/MutR family transcriptional regulator [Lactobacillus sp. LL6]TSO25556.1 Rgg/GadR/MutR family transcriptional regulator [Lactobacillus sp. LL6]
MKQNLGKIFRQIRQSKQITITSLADENLSKSQISRFEREESEISCNKLINLLNKLHISLDEYILLCGMNSDNSFIKLEKYIGEKHREKDFDSIKRLLKSSPYKLNSLEKTMLKSIIYSLDKSIYPNEEEMIELTDYLFKVEKWGYYEIVLLGNCMRTISYQTLFTLTKEMINSYVYSSTNKTNKKLVVQLAINCLLVSIDRKEFNDCEYLIEEIDKILNNEFFYYEKTVFLYAQGYLEYKRKNKFGKIKMNEAIQIFKILGESTMVDYYGEHYKNVINTK